MWEGVLGFNFAVEFFIGKSWKHNYVSFGSVAQFVSFEIRQLFHEKFSQRKHIAVRV